MENNITTFIDCITHKMKLNTTNIKNSNIELTNYAMQTKSDVFENTFIISFDSQNKKISLMFIIQFIDKNINDKAFSAKHTISYNDLNKVYDKYDDIENWLNYQILSLNKAAGENILSLYTNVTPMIFNKKKPSF